jgi:tetratricopeptide (TPR) repeat protein
MTVNDTSLIERYLAGELSNEEVQAFELRLSTDVEFAENFKLYQSIESEMHVDEDEAELEKELSRHTKKYFAEEEKGKVIPIGSVRKKRWLYAAIAAAACVALLLVFKPWQEHKLSNEELYAQNAVPEDLPTTLRGTNEDSLFSRATELYNKKDYVGALPLLDSITRIHPVEAQLQFALGVCYLQTNKFELAVNKFDSLAAGQSIYHYDAFAWKAYVYLKQNNKEACIAALKQIPAEAPNYKKAEKLIKDLSK